jgi:hypothetical protein
MPAHRVAAANPRLKMASAGAEGEGRSAFPRHGDPPTGGFGTREMGMRRPHAG